MHRSIGKNEGLRRVKLYLNQTKGMDSYIGVNWWHRFVERWQGVISPVRETSMGQDRRDRVNEDNLKKFYNQFHTIMEDFQILPYNLWNTDECGDEINAKISQIVYKRRGNRRGVSSSPNTRDHITFFATSNAKGIMTKMKSFFFTLKKKWNTHLSDKSYAFIYFLI